LLSTFINTPEKFKVNICSPSTRATSYPSHATLEYLHRKYTRRRLIDSHLINYSKLSSSISAGVQTPAEK